MTQHDIFGIKIGKGTPPEVITHRTYRITRTALLTALDIEGNAKFIKYDWNKKMLIIKVDHKDNNEEPKK